MTTRGFSAIGVYHPKNGINVGGLVRSARAFGASFVFTIGRRYRGQASATDAHLQVPILNFLTVDEWRAAMPPHARLVAVEIDDRARSLESYIHPERAIYLLGAEDTGLPDFFLRGCEVVSIPSTSCLNVASAGTVVLYDREAKLRNGFRRRR